MIALASNLPDWNALHFLRPEWLWALLALPVILALALYRQRRSDVWRQAVDAHLLPHLLAAGTRRVRACHGRAAGLDAGSAGDGRAELAAAGTADVPGQRTAAGRAGSVQPDHRHRPATVAPAAGAGQVGELLRARQGGQVGLVVYADDAYTVAPLTDDGSNVALYLDALSPDVMPRWPACRPWHRLGHAADAADRCTAGADPAGHRSGRW
jgi:Ca-activated chloride channel family protein